MPTDPRFVEAARAALKFGDFPIERPTGEDSYEWVNCPACATQEDADDDEG